MEEIKKIIKQTKDLLMDIDCTNYKMKLFNQKKVSKAYNKLEDLERVVETAESDLYEANKRIADLLLILGDRDRMIDLMAQAIDNYDSQLEINSYRDKAEIIEAFKEAMKRRDFRERKRKGFEERCK